MKILLVLHNHQPCDNFGWVFEDAYKKAYEPFIGLLEKYPRVKVAIHYSGSLLEWFEKHRPEFISRIKSLVKERRITLLTGGFYEPIFPVIPDRDKIGQINLLTDFIKNHFEYNPTGLWITERVWEENLSDIFLGLGLKYTIVDDFHLKQAGIPNENIHGYFELKNGFKIFASSKLLRYMIPFAKINEIERYFKGLPKELENTFFVFGDDGEKFGLWPHMYEWIYRKGWLRRFFDLLSDNSSVIKTVSFDEAFGLYKPNAQVHLPASSYSEMMEWSKGDFNNFFKFYPEANIMRNRMLEISKELEKVSSEAPTTSKQKILLDEAKKELYKAQSGCAYWHGVFGGLYLNHLRSGVYRHLINVQKILEELSNRNKIYFQTHDFDNDQSDEVKLGNSFIDLYIKPNRCGSIFELDDKRKSYNMVNIITRRREIYHNKLFGAKKTSISDIKKEFKNNGYVNIYDVLGIRERGLKKFLIYDDGKKDSMVDYFLAGDFSLKDFSRGKFENLIRLRTAPFNVNKIIDNDVLSFMLEKIEEIELRKELYKVYIKKEVIIPNLPEFSVKYTIKNLSEKKLFTTFAVEFNWSFMNRFFMKTRDLKRIDSFLLKDEWSGTALRHRFNELIRLWATPIYTLNETERGLGKTYQYLSLLVQKPISLKNDECKEFKSTVTIE